jgi:hypothetical protein
MMRAASTSDSMANCLRNRRCRTKVKSLSVVTLAASQTGSDNLVSEVLIGKQNIVTFGLKPRLTQGVCHRLTEPQRSRSVISRVSSDIWLDLRLPSSPCCPYSRTRS